MPARLTSQKRGGTSPPNSPGNRTPSKTKIHTINSTQIQNLRTFTFTGISNLFLVVINKTRNIGDSKITEADRERRLGQKTIDETINLRRTPGKRTIRRLGQGLAIADETQVYIEPATLLNRAATTPGTSYPTLFDKCVGSLTSHGILELKEL